MTGPWSPFDYCHILEVFAVPVVTQPVLSAFVMAAALGLLRVRRAGGLRSGEPLEKTAHHLLCDFFVISLNKAKRSSKKPQRSNNLLPLILHSIFYNAIS